jgi:hypothetical protein
MTTPLTQSQFQSQVKYAKICSYKAYIRLFNWYVSEYCKGRPPHSIDTSMSIFKPNTTKRKKDKNTPVKCPFEFDADGNFIPYTQPELEPESKPTRPRDTYYSKFLENVINKFFLFYTDRNENRKQEDKGKYYNGEYHFNKTTKKGRADCVWSVPIEGGLGTKMLNFEVKVLGDTMKPDQIKEMERAISKGEVFEVIKTVDDFWGALDSMPELMLNKKGSWWRLRVGV